MKMKVSELSGAALDWAVAKCEGKVLPPEPVPPNYEDYLESPLPLTLWETHFHYVGDSLKRVSVSPIEVARIGCLPGCSEMSISATDATGCRFLGSIEEYFATKEDAELSAARAMSGCDEHFFPSTNWSQGGPIIERENISVVCAEGKYSAAQKAYTTYWVAEKGRASPGEIYGPQGDYYGDYFQIEESAMSGPTPLIAGLRCYVASKVGDEVEVPEDFL